MSAINPELTSIDLPKTRGLIITLLFAGLGGLYTAINTWNLFLTQPLLNKWSLIVIFAISIIAMGSAILIFQRKGMGLVLGLLSISFLSCLFLIQTESQVILAVSGLGEPIFAIPSIAGLLVCFVSAYYLVQYLINPDKRDHFS